VNGPCVATITGKVRADVWPPGRPNGLWGGAPDGEFWDGCRNMGVNAKADGVMTWICCALADMTKELKAVKSTERDSLEVPRSRYVDLLVDETHEQNFVPFVGTWL
jgi:hypothetical protein